ncbi:hypothetical protein Acsp05_46490 [Actinokineospora sp. NBRC 105648]|nr:hypothetical protein Acsp05_46490 [Actinokineospora sp. NBRC 105648]
MAALAAVGVFAFAVPAHAQVRADSSGAVGGGMALFGTEAVDIGPLAPCAAGGPGNGTTTGAESDFGLVKYGRGSGTCAFDPESGVASANVTGQDFEVNGLTLYGGPSIGISSFSASCTTTETGIKRSVALSGVTGVALPDEVPEDYTVIIPGPNPNQPMARLVFNDTAPADPTDLRSESVHVLKVHLYPRGGGAASGTLTVGSVSCNPPGR